MHDSDGWDDSIYGAIAVSSIIAMGCMGCESGTKKSKKPVIAPEVELQVTHHIGGTHYRTIIHDGRWYQTFGNMLLVMDPRTARPINEIELCKYGTCGPAIDMAITQAGDMYIVLERDELLSLSLDDPEKPEIIARRTYDVDWLSTAVV